MVKDSNTIEQEDVDALKNPDWTGADIMDAIYHGTTQADVDKIFNAFKIDLEI
ncbi:MAG: hypothetical protein Q7U54_00435 [Bacteroidales bacterium]|nr:hypothetical protein [Bacteroidales bacterium]